ncbi:MAG: hypothetical protein Q8M11_02390 [Sulfuritalea sp.]|nr:hypothetical protein [Sulfuritalea sp.]MDP1981116.1 hypothetical protein [Sulfuritalea sp.]
MDRFGSGLAWCIILALGLAADVGFGQSRSAAGVIQPVAADPVVGAAGKATDRSKQKSVGKPAVRKVQSKPKTSRSSAPGPQIKALTRVKPQAKSGSADHRRPPIPSGVDADSVEQCWQQIQAALQPARLIRLSEECERNFPASQFAEQIRGIADRARQTLDIQRSIGLSGDFFEDAIGDASYRDNLGKAVRGDKDAAYLIALAYRIGVFGVAASSRRMEQWLRFSAELGSGLASWELAEFYNYGGLVADAARYEKKAVELGYRPPFRLPTRGY